MGECQECEAALLCRDFLSLGYSKLLVDPGVRLAYSADVARQRYTQKVPSLLRHPFSRVRLSRADMIARFWQFACVLSRQMLLECKPALAAGCTGAVFPSLNLQLQGEGFP